MFSILPKRCATCKELKSRSEFYERKKTSDGLEERCKDCSKAAAKKWRQANPESVRQSHNREKEKQARRTNSKLWKLLNPLKVLEQKRRYIAKHPETKQQWDRDRRAKKKGNGGTVTKEEWQAILDKYGHKCLYPGCNRTDLTMDHVVPLVLGGKHEAGNIQPLCNYHNRAKYNKTVDYR
jgi:5-methylcytosine-specific restriction endonuclease McrA